MNARAQFVIIGKYIDIADDRMRSYRFRAKSKKAAIAHADRVRSQQKDNPFVIAVNVARVVGDVSQIVY